MNQQEHCLRLIKAFLKDMLHYEDKEHLPSNGWEARSSANPCFQMKAGVLLCEKQGGGKK